MSYKFTHAVHTFEEMGSDPTGLSNNSGGGDIVTFGTGTLTAGKLYFLNSSGAWTETDADAISTSDGLLGSALGTAPSDGVLLRGFFDDQNHISTVFGNYCNEHFPYFQNL